MTGGHKDENALFNIKSFVGYWLVSLSLVKEKVEKGMVVEVCV